MGQTFQDTFLVQVVHTAPWVVNSVFILSRCLYRLYNLNNEMHTIYTIVFHNINYWQALHWHKGFYYSPELSERDYKIIIKRQEIFHGNQVIGL